MERLYCSAQHENNVYKIHVIGHDTGKEISVLQRDSLQEVIDVMEEILEFNKTLPKQKHGREDEGASARSRK